MLCCPPVWWFSHVRCLLCYSLKVFVAPGRICCHWGVSSWRSCENLTRGRGWLWGLCFIYGWNMLQTAHQSSWSEKENKMHTPVSEPQRKWGWLEDCILVPPLWFSISSWLWLVTCIAAMQRRKQNMTQFFFFYHQAETLSRARQNWGPSMLFLHFPNDVSAGQVCTQAERLNPIHSDS